MGTEYYSEFNNDEQQRELRLVKEARRKRNIAAVLDLASSFISQYGRERGVVFRQQPVRTAAYQKIYDTLNSRYKERYGDYGGKIASRTLFPSSGKANKYIPFHASFSPSISLSPRAKQPRLLKGDFESVLNKYKSNNNKKRNYVFSKS